MDIEDLPRHPFTTAQAALWGLSERRLRSAVNSRLVVRMLRGVYLRADVEPSVSAKVAAAALVIHEGSVVCDRTAAWIWGVDVYDFRELDVVPPIETCVLRGGDPTDRREVLGMSRDLVPCDWVEVEGVLVTTPVRTALDLGCSLSRRSALAAIDALMRLHGFSSRDLRRHLVRYFRRRGVIQLRELVPIADPRPESQPESWTRIEMMDHGLPQPELQWWVCIDGVPTYRLDLAYPHARIAVEYDGEEFHTGDEDRARDAVRRAWLRENGWTVIVVDKASFTAEAVEVWIGEIRAALAEAAKRRTRPYPSRA